MLPAALLLCSVAFVGHGSNNATEPLPCNLSRTSDDAHGRLLALNDGSRRRGRRSAERNGSRSLQATPRRPHERANATAAPHHHHREARWRVRTGRFARTPAGLALAVAPVAWDRPAGQQLGSEGSIALTNRPGLLRDLLLTAAFAVLGGFALMHCASRRSLRISWIYSSEGNTHALLRSNKMLLLLTINLTNLGCHSVFSILAAFFPQEAKAKGATDEMVGLIFASFACVIFVASPLAARLMSRHGKSYVYIAGVVIVSLSTISFAVADALPAGWPFTGWCLLMRLVQGFGSALEETAAYALIADVDPERVSFLLGITEMSTGLGYMVGPPLGGWLFSIGGFRTPFLLLGVLLLPAAALIHQRVPPELCRQEALEKHEDGERDVPLGDLLRNPQILLIAVASVLANSDYAFLEPTLGDHAKALGIATSPDSIGLLFSVSSVCYTISCPAIGLLSDRSRIGPRPMIYAGLLAQAIGFLLIGPSPLLGWLHGGSASWLQVVGGLVLFGVGESMSMTPVMDDMMHSCGTAASSCINALSSLMASAFSLGQMVGPLAGTALASHMGLPWAGTLMALLICLQLFLMAAADLWLPHAGRLRGFMPLTQNAAAATELERFTSSGSSQSRHGSSAAISSGDEL